MQQIDKLHTEFPFAGARMLRRLLAADGSKVGRRHVKRLMSRMARGFVYLAVVLDWFSRRGVTKQAEVVGIARSTVYYLPRSTRDHGRSSPCVQQSRLAERAL